MERSLQYLVDAVTQLLQAQKNEPNSLQDSTLSPNRLEAIYSPRFPFADNITACEFFDEAKENEPLLQEVK
jgi:hypothetical protein